MTSCSYSTVRKWRGMMDVCMCLNTFSPSIYYTSFFSYLYYLQCRPSGCMYYDVEGYPLSTHKLLTFHKCNECKQNENKFLCFCIRWEQIVIFFVKKKFACILMRPLALYFYGPLDLRVAAIVWKENNATHTTTYSGKIYLVVFCCFLAKMVICRTV